MEKQRAKNNQEKYNFPHSVGKFGQWNIKIIVNLQ